MTYFFKTPFANAGDKVAIPLAAQPDGSMSYTDGYGINYQLDPGTEPTALDIPRDQFNQLMYAVTQALQQYQQKGFPDFITTADNGGTPYEYSINATVRFEDGWAGAGFMNYYSLVDANDADPTDQTKWGLVEYLSTPELPGVCKEYYGSTLPSGYVWANGTTIGNASSGATGRANADTVDLFTLLWNSMSNTVLPIQTSAGAASTRGANAAADYAANKRLPVPDKRGRVSAGKGDMGGVTDAALITTAGCGIDGATLGAYGGAQNVALTSNQNGQHSHSGTTGGAGGHTHLNGVADNQYQLTLFTAFVYGYSTSGIPGQALGTISTEEGGASLPPYVQGYTETIGNHTHTFSTGNSGLGSAHLNVQPTIISNFIIKL